MNLTKLLTKKKTLDSIISDIEANLKPSATFATIEEVEVYCKENNITKCLIVKKDLFSKAYMNSIKSGVNSKT